MVWDRPNPTSAVSLAWISRDKIDIVAIGMTTTDATRRLVSKPFRSWCPVSVTHASDVALTVVEDRWNNLLNRIATARVINASRIYA